MSSDVAVAVAGLGKRFEIYERPHHRLLQTMLRGRRRFYREFWALCDVTLSVRRGETLGIVGRNGSGKSTLLQLVAGTLTPTTGTVETRGRVAALLELGSGFNPEFTGRENAFLNGAILGLTRQEMHEAFDAIEAFAEIGDFVDQPIKTYSSGMVMRLAFAVAVHVSPEILIVDEALSVGDTAFQSKCLARIRDMQRAGVAILFVSHSSNTVIEFCDRAAYLERGKLVVVDDSRDVMARYARDMTASVGGTTLPASTGATAGAEVARSRVVPPRAAGPAPPTEIVSCTILDTNGTPREGFARDDVIVVRVDVVFNRDNPAPCYGIQLKSPDDIILWTCTTQLMEVPLEPRAAGARATIEWRVRASLGGGRYVVAVGCGDRATGVYLPHSRMHYAGHFDVVTLPRRGVGWLDPDVSFEARE